MAHAVFLRAANVGGTSVFRPSALVQELADLDLASIGAAGTFAVRAPASAAAVRKRIAAALPFETEVIVVPAKAVLRLVAAAAHPAPAGAKRFVTILTAKPGKVPPLPMAVPDARAWEVKLVAVEDAFALCWDRHAGRRRFYPNEVVERHLGVRATTRGWDTMVKVAQKLEEKS